MQKKFATACLATAIAGAGITIAEQQAHATPSKPVAAHVEKSHRAAPAARDVDADASRYAAREAGAKEQQQYQGGAMLVVGISATAAIVALVLLLLLL
jgi:hypothetical protein